MKTKKWYFYAKVDTIKGTMNYYVGSVECKVPERTFFNTRLISLLGSDENYVRGVGYTDNKDELIGYTHKPLIEFEI
jgi:hypothetical protein